jgi:hypothetical protein
LKIEILVLKLINGNENWESFHERSIWWFDLILSWYCKIQGTNKWKYIDISSDLMLLIY